eukprot:10529746-Alexandrium_andersonii.AAC.1
MDFCAPGAPEGVPEGVDEQSREQSGRLNWRANDQHVCMSSAPTILATSSHSRQLSYRRRPKASLGQDTRRPRRLSCFSAQAKSGSAAARM